MGKMSKVSMLVAVLGLAVAEQSARADWILSVVDAGGASARTVGVGDMFQLNIVVSDPTSDETITSFDMSLSLSGDAGVTFDSYSLSPRAFTVPDNDFSNLGALNFSAGTDTGSTFFGILPTDGGSATLVTLNLTATDPGGLSIDTVPGFFDLDFFTSVATTAGAPFQLTVVPEPATLALLGLGGVFAMRRRRKLA